MSSRQNGKSAHPSTAFGFCLLCFSQGLQGNIAVWAFLLGLSSLHSTNFGVLCSHFHSFPSWSLLWPDCHTVVCCSVSRSLCTFYSFYCCWNLAFSLWSDRTQCVISIVLYLLVRLASSPHAVYWSPKDCWENCQCLGECYVDNLLDPSDLTFFKSRVSQSRLLISPPYSTTVMKLNAPIFGAQLGCNTVSGVIPGWIWSILL